MPYSTNERTESDKGLDRAKQGTEIGLNEGANSVDRLGRNTNKLVDKANKARDFLKDRKNSVNKGAKTGADATNTAANTGNTVGAGATGTGTGATGVGATTGGASTTGGAAATGAGASATGAGATGVGAGTTGANATGAGATGAGATGAGATAGGATAAGATATAGGATAGAAAGTGATVGGISSTGYGAIALAIIAVVIIVVIVLACVFCILYVQITAALLGMESESENNSEITARAEEIMENFWAYTTLSPGKNRSKDAEKLVEIQNNGYTTALCAVYEELVYNGYYGNSKLNGEDDNTYDKIFSTPNESMFNERFAVYYLDRKKNKNSSYVTDFLYNRKKSFYDFDGQYTNDNYVNTAAHYYYSDNIMSMCINAFVDPDTGEIYKDIDTFKSEYKNHLKNNNETIPKDKDELSEGCRKYVLSKVLKNIEGKKGLANTCVVYQSQDKKGKDSYIYFYDCIRYTQKMNDKYKIPKSVKETIYSYEVTFRTFSSSSATAICNLALEQDGNDGYKYWNNTKAWTGGEGAAWCAIFCAWLMEQQGINVNDVGWSSRCSVWVGNAKSKGIFRSADTYKPKAGDFIFFDWHKGDSFVAEHVGIVVSTDNGKIMTIEGNSTGGRVRHNDKTHDTGVIGYIEMTYSESNIIGSGIEQPLLSSVLVDSKYKGYKLSLTSSQRRKIESLITNENKANGYIGCCLIAQCIKDAIRYEKKNADNIKVEMGYSAADTGAPCENAKKAVKYVFDDGGYAVKHKLLYMYNPNLCTSSWHEAQVFIVEHGSGINRVRYFDNYKKIN